jgi:hypothetical protein
MTCEPKSKLLTEKSTQPLPLDSSCWGLLISVLADLVERAAGDSGLVARHMMEELAKRQAAVQAQAGQGGRERGLMSPEWWPDPFSSEKSGKEWYGFLRGLARDVDLHVWLPAAKEIWYQECQECGETESPSLTYSEKRQAATARRQAATALRKQVETAAAAAIKVHRGWHRGSRDACAKVLAKQRPEWRIDSPDTDGRVLPILSPRGYIRAFEAAHGRPKN